MGQHQRWKADGVRQGLRRENGKLGLCGDRLEVQREGAVLETGGGGGLLYAAELGPENG